MSEVLDRPRIIAEPSAVRGSDGVLSEAAGYTATRHQREIGTGYFDAIAGAISGGEASTVALRESTEAAQFISREAIAAE